MKINHIIAVFKAEYYTTTSKFRALRKYIPILFIIGILAFSSMLRAIYDLFRGDFLVLNPPITTFFSIMVIFSYFILFTPLLSPLGRVVYDGGAKSRREVALNAPVSSNDLLYGNLLSNLAFFLPFFGFIGTITLLPFVGNGIFSPLVTSLALFGILSLLILVGLVGGTMISPIVFSFISSRKNSQTRAIVAFSVSAMLVISLPIFRYFLENTTLDGEFGWITYLPFTLAAIMIIYVLYGLEIALPIGQATLFLSLYILGLVILAYLSAPKIYEIDNEQNDFSSANPESAAERSLHFLTKPIPFNLRYVVQATMKASLRDIEHLARLTIGLSISIFMIFALSSRGLFRGTANFDERIELAVIIFALVLSSASVIFIEASSFTIQHRDMFALIKSAPNGARKFVIGKVIQMVLLLVPVFISMIVALSLFGFISTSNLLPLSITIVLVLITMSTLSLAIYLVNPSDNEEDLGNFINLLFFYLISFIVAVGPVVIVIGDYSLQTYQFLLIILVIIVSSSTFLWVGSEALERMNLETLDSPLSKGIIHGLKTIGFFIFGWNFIPLLGIGYLVSSGSIIGFIVLNYGLITGVCLTYYLATRSYGNALNFSSDSFKFLLLTAVAMILLGMVSSTVFSFFFSQDPELGINRILDLRGAELILLVIAISAVEELFFRGVLLDYSDRYIETKYSSILNALIFGFIHLVSLVSLFNAFIQGLLLVLLKRRTKSVIYPIIAHICYNIAILSLV